MKNFTEYIKENNDDSFVEYSYDDVSKFTEDMEDIINDMNVTQVSPDIVSNAENILKYLRHCKNVTPSI